MVTLHSLTPEQEKHMKIVQKLRILKEFNRRLAERVSELKNKQA